MSRNVGASEFWLSPVWTLCVATLLWNSRVYGQEALRSNVSADPAIRAAQNEEPALNPDRAHVGPVELESDIYVNARYDDNINLSKSAAQSDTILGIGLDVGLLWPVADSSTVQLHARVGYLNYLEHSIYDSLELAPDSAVVWDISIGDGGITLYDQLSYSREVITEGSLSGVASLPRFNNTAGVRLRWLPGDWWFEAGYSYDIFLSESARYLERSSDFLLVRAAWRFGEDGQAGLESSGSWTDYRLASQSDNWSYSVGPYAEWRVADFLRASLRGGPTFYSFQATVPGATGTELGSYYFGGNLNYQMTDYFRHDLSVERDVRLGLNQGTKFIEQLTVHYSVHWAVTRDCGIGAEVVYEHGSQPLNNPFFIVTEDFDRIGFSPSIDYAITRKLSARMFFWHWDRQSDFSEREYVENSVALSLTYRL